MSVQDEKVVELVECADECIDPLFPDVATETTQNPVAEYILGSDERIVAAEHAWQKLNKAIAHWTSNEQKECVLDLLGISPTPDNSREYKRTTSKLLLDVMRNVNSTLVEAKWDAQMMIWGNDKQCDQAREAFDGIDEALGDYEDDTYEAYFLNLRKTATELFVGAYTADNELVEPLYELIAQDAQQIVDLLELFEDPEIDSTDYRGLLNALARNYFDPADTSLVTACLDELKKRPDIYQPYHFSQIDSAESGVDNSQKLATLIGKFALQHNLDQETVGVFLRNIDLKELPELIQTEIAENLSEHLSDIGERFTRLLTPYKHPRRFVFREKPTDYTDKSGSSSKKRSKRHRNNSGSDRVTAKSAGNTVFGESDLDEQRRNITEICFAKKVSNNFIIDGSRIEIDDTGSKAERDSAIEQIMVEKPFSDYTEKYRNPGDVRQMLNSILDDPINNGVSIMRQQRISLKTSSEAYPKQKRVYHFSPNDSYGIEFSESPESNRTRIFFVIIDDRLVILDIQHKTVAQRQSGHFRKS